MFKFAVLENHRSGMNLKYGWCFVVSSMLDLIAYNQDVMTGKIKKAFNDSTKSLQTGMHQTDFLSSCIITSASLNGDSLVNAYAKFTEKLANGQISMLEKYGILYFQRSGGYFPHSNDINVICQTETETLVWPSSHFLLKELKITKWNEGRHWYVICPDGMIVKDHDGDTRFNTYEYALEVAKKFVDESNKLGA